ncbi:hypothetical protein H310_01172 [Aphanomyces invadans]|uniref:Kinesin-like protein n=1 Tax=Aphanomyces invadans TaxID=157072 RepID=A0A024UQB3_9STRA|nr:hypothetical protein H310_01172 [Aphanomyces invadans]ETW08636.1 hypothetical protein H310_01172 [Aphanomyces invadans]|eukprot:XP_008862441.1 hypothetical protein H310_01172 [Aphanomyces invadans]
MHKRVKVCIRVRPASKDHAGIQVNEHEKVYVSAARLGADDASVLLQTISVVNEPNGNGTCFHFDDVLGSQVTQEQVYQRVAAEAVESVMNGYNGTVMAYGQTGAGKTFTMSGGKTCFADRGICARSISSMFQAMQNDSDHSYSVRVSYIEIYNEQLYDLLDFSETSHKDLVVQENDRGQTFIKGLSKPAVDNEGAALDFLFQGDTNRTIAEHCLNSASTRSHCIFSLHIEKRSREATSSPVVESKLNLVDLAGSERMKKTQVTGTMLKETMHINKSLTFLEQVVIALGDHKRDHIPYRQTTLTNILKDSLGGNCRTLLIACVWPDESQNDQTLATLKFATRMMRVKTSAIVNVTQEQHQQAKKYLDEIKQLKVELALHDSLAGRSHVVYDPVSREQELEMKAAIKAFVASDGSSALPVVNFVQVQTLFRLFREVAIEYREGRLPVTTDPAILPPYSSQSSCHDVMSENQQDSSVPNPLLPMDNLLEPKHSNDTAVADAALLDEFKEHVAAQLEEAKQSFRKAKKKVVQCANDVNLAKSEIDTLSKELHAVCNDVDQRELVGQLKDVKKKYRTAFEALSDAQAELNYLKKTKDQLVASAATDFDIWYT